MINNKANERYGLSGIGWNKVLTALEYIQDIIKGVIVVLGVLSATIADTAMGAISVTILFGTNVAQYTSTPVWILSTVLSLGASAFQIYLFALIQKRKIGFLEILHWKKLPKDVKAYVATAGLLWFLDTLMDVSPVFLLVENSKYKAIPELYLAMVIAVLIVVFILCGFSELLTSNMRGMLETSFTGSRQPYSPSVPPRQQEQTKKYIPQTSSGKKDDFSKKNSDTKNSTVEEFLREREKFNLDRK